MHPRLKILAVEDDVEIRELLVNIFTKEGLQARVVGSLSEFRICLAQEDATICLIDIGLPDGDGLSLVSELRKDSARGIVILTGRGSELDHVLGLEMGADDYVVKPFRPKELVARLNAVMRRLELQHQSASGGSEKRPHKFVIHGYDVDLESRDIVDAHGSTINLTTAEFDVLRVLIEHRGQIISRDDIIKAVKGATWHATTRGVDGLISRLRKKLPIGSDGKVLIKTLHGSGYMLTPEDTPV